MFCTERGSPPSGGVKITFRSHRSQQPATRGVMLRYGASPFRSSSYARPNAQLTNQTEGIISSRLRLAEFIQTRAPNQLPSEEFRRIRMKMREGLLPPLPLSVHFQTGGFGILRDRRFYKGGRMRIRGGLKAFGLLPTTSYPNSKHHGPWCGDSASKGANKIHQSRVNSLDRSGL